MLRKVVVVDLSSLNLWNDYNKRERVRERRIIANEKGHMHTILCTCIYHYHNPSTNETLVQHME